MVNGMKNILVLCTGNSCRSQMAEGFLQKYVGDKARVYSAGIEVHGVNPIAIKVMQESKVDISKHTSNNVEEYKNIEFDYIITVCDNAQENCPVYYSSAMKFHHSFLDPARASGDEEQILSEFRNVRDLIDVFSYNFVMERF